MTIYKYPLDTTGVSTTNKIQDEEQFLTEANFKDYRYVIPDFSPFYLNNLIVIHVQTDGSKKVLTEGIDYYPALQYVAATRSIGREIWGGISFTNKNIQGTVLLTYQTLGGKWVGDRYYVLESLAERNYNPRIAYWDDVTNVQEVFPVINHEQDYDTIYGQDKVIESIDRLSATIANNILNNDTISYLKHIVNYDNPHKLTLEQLGYQIAEQTDMDNDKESLSKLVNVKMFFDNNRKTIEDIADLNSRLEDLTLKVNKLEDKTTEISNKLSMSIDDVVTLFNEKLNTVREEITNSLLSHINDKSNPHAVTKGQVGLGNVENLPLATDHDVEQNLPLNKYLTLKQIVKLINVTPSYVLKGYNQNPILGETINLTFNTEKVSDGTVFYWKVKHHNTRPDMFVKDHGEIMVDHGVSTFTVTIADRISPRGVYEFTINVYANEQDEGSLVAKTLTITIDNSGIDDQEYYIPWPGLGSLYDPDIALDDKVDMVELYFYRADRTISMGRDLGYKVPSSLSKHPGRYLTDLYNLYTDDILSESKAPEWFFYKVDPTEQDKRTIG